MLKPSSECNSLALFRLARQFSKIRPLAMQPGSQPSQVQKRLSEAVASFTQRWQLCQAAGPSPGCLCQIWLPQIGTDGSTSLYTQVRDLQGWSRVAAAASMRNRHEMPFPASATPSAH